MTNENTAADITAKLLCAIIEAHPNADLGTEGITEPGKSVAQAFAAMLPIVSEAITRRS